MSQFKQILFVRLKRQPKPIVNSENQQSKPKFLQMTAIMRKVLNWSECIQRHQIRQVFMNYEGKAIYNNGIIIREVDNNSYDVQLVSSVPKQLCISTEGTPFEQQKNFINYNFQRSHFQSNPLHLFQTVGYKRQNTFQYKQVEYYRSLSFGLEVMIYPKHGYLQIIQTFLNKNQCDPLNSMASCLLKQLKGYLQTTQVIMALGNMRPQDFVQEFS